MYKMYRKQNLACVSEIYDQLVSFKGLFVESASDSSLTTDDELPSNFPVCFEYESFT